jgi:hypothetical protein
MSSLARPDKLLRLCAHAASALVLLMFSTFAFTGIGQDPLQYMHPVADYTALLLRNPPVLTAVIGLDTAFILFYSTMFAALATVLWQGTAPRLWVVLSLGLLGVTGMLDLAENLHFMAMLSSAAQGLPISPGEIGAQVLESLLKFHLSYLGLFLLGFVLPNETPLQKFLCFLLRWVQWPVGLLIYLVPPALAVPLVMARFSFFLVSLLAIAAVYRQPRDSRERGSGAPA